MSAIFVIQNIEWAQSKDYLIILCYDKYCRNTSKLNNIQEIFYEETS